MKLQQFIDALYLDDSDKMKMLYKEHGKNIFQDTKLLIALLDLEWSEKKDFALSQLAWTIASELGKKKLNMEHIFSNGILPIYEHFQEYMYSTCRLAGVPFEEYEEVQKEYIDLLKTLVQEGRVKNFENSPRYKKCRKKHSKLRSKLVKKHPHLDNP